MKNEQLKVITKGKPSLEMLNEKQKEIIFSELLSAFLNYKKEKDLKSGKKE